MAPVSKMLDRARANIVVTTGTMREISYLPPTRSPHKMIDSIYKKPKEERRPSDLQPEWVRHLEVKLDHPVEAQQRALQECRREGQ
ncbi:hypothetical protein F4824DRAFT_466568 [Ustulina deusta]|nr:hypothetical protein F4824DRAFT_466568 [Ustulina deusta]